MFRNKALGWALKLSDTIPINREKNDIEAICKIISETNAISVVD